MEQNAYGSLWNQRSTDADSAMAAVDGSGDEAALRQTGLWSANQVIAALDVNGRDHVLELGCGVGRIGRELAEHCGHWTGVDIAENMIRHARVRLAGFGNVSFHTLNRSALDMIETETVDKAYSIAVFCHMDKEDLYLYLQDLHRVLRPGGLIFVETWNLVHPVGWRRWEYEPQVWSRADQSQRKEIGRNQFCTPEEFALYVSKAGFDVLANYDQSQSVQIVAGKGLDPAARQAQIQRLDRDAARAVYSPLYAELFGLYVDVIFGAVPATEMLAFMDDDERAESPEVALFRPHLMAMWRKKGDQWGEFPG
jgi:cyclopropane fatty-acyl-phospholipid synthase-like methyltransferase